MGNGHISTANRDNRAMSHRITERNFQRKRNKIRDSDQHNRGPQPKQFGSDSELLRRRKRDKSELIATLIVLAGIVVAIVSSLWAQNH